METTNFTYHDHETTCKGFLAFEGSSDTKRPAVLIAHDWSGCNDFAKDKANRLAELGYVGIAIDMFGDGKIGHDKDEKSALIQPFMEDRSLLRQRITAALTNAKKLPMVDTTRIAAIGFCFGGLCVLDLARSGANIKGVVSFHGLLMPPPDTSGARISAKILALHGHDDPLVPPAQVLAFEQEMTAHKVDWQLDIYGNTMHGFTNPLANDPVFGTVYNKPVANRAWLSMKMFFDEIFG